MKPAASSDVTRIMLFVLAIGVLLAGSFWTLLPFLGMSIWAVTIVLATWPVLLRLQQLVRGRRCIAVTIMTLLVFLAFIVPFALALITVINATMRSPALIHDFLARGIGPPPQWIANFPLLGHQVADKWTAVAAGGADALAETVRPYTRAATTWAIAAVGGFGGVIVNVLLALILIAILYSQGEVAARGVLALAARLGGETGEGTVRLAGQAVRSVALGVVVTALLQSVLAGLGLWVSGVPHPGLLTAIAFMLGIAQLGPLLVLAPAVIWLYWIGNPGWAIALAVWSLPIIPLDNVLRPILIRRGVQLPMLLIIAGVIGGLISFGMVGLFVGPVILAATYTLAKNWVAMDRPDSAAR